MDQMVDVRIPACDKDLCGSVVQIRVHTLAIHESSHLNPAIGDLQGCKRVNWARISIGTSLDDHGHDGDNSD
jgi:hypothetical protein